jgi:hypothetical protein
MMISDFGTRHINHAYAFSSFAWVSMVSGAFIIHRLFRQL